jgi:hypothetical protein
MSVQCHFAVRKAVRATTALRVFYKTPNSAYELRRVSRVRSQKPMRNVSYGIKIYRYVTGAVKI